MSHAGHNALPFPEGEGDESGIGFAQRVRQVPDWILYPWRRHSAVAALTNRPRPDTLLTVCHGNICRSPFAAAVLAQTLPGVRVSSAGFIGPGRSAPDEAIAAAARYHIDLAPHRSRVLTAEVVRAATIIVTMDVIQRREIRERFGRADRDLFVLGDFDPESTDARTIRDPVSQPLPVFEEVYARIVRCARGLERIIGPTLPQRHAAPR